MGKKCLILYYVKVNNSMNFSLQKRNILEFPAPKKKQTTRNAVRDKQTIHARGHSFAKAKNYGQNRLKLQHVNENYDGLNFDVLLSWTAGQQGLQCPR